MATEETSERGIHLADSLQKSAQVSLVVPGTLRDVAPSGLELVVVEDLEVEVTPPYLARSYAFYRALAGFDFDVIIFPSAGGHAYCAARARQVGLDFGSSAIVVDCTEPTLRTAERQRAPFLSKRLLGVGIVERIVFELADAFVCEDEGVLDWLEERRWILPAQRLPAPQPEERWEVRSEARVASSDREPPLVSVVIAFHERTSYLSFCLESLAAQTYPALEVIVADDGSQSGEAAEFLAVTERRSWPWPLRILHLPQGGLGAARNGGWRAANGDLVLFLDDDDVAFRELVATLVRSREISGADVAVAGARFFRGDGAPVARRDDVVRISLCEPRELGLISNQYGGPVNLWPRELLGRLNGFATVPTEDWDLLARATYAGARLTTPPDPLYWYRQTRGSMYSADPRAFRDAGLAARAERVAERLPEEWRLLPQLAAGGYSELERRRAEAPSGRRAAFGRWRRLVRRAWKVRAEDGVAAAGREAVRFARRRYDRRP